MTANTQPRWVTILTRLATHKPGWTLGFVAVLTVVSVALAEHLELRMNWTDLLPEGDRTVQLYRDVQDRFGDPSIVVALEGDRDAIVAMAEELEPRLEAMEGLHNVWGKLPVEFIRDHGFVLLKQEQFDRALRSFEDWTLVGALRGLNDDYETEYTDSESNMRRDEVDVARGVLGISRALELLQATVAGDQPPQAIAEAADALAIGEPWMLSLDREMLLISCTPTATIVDIESTIETVEQVEAIIAEVGANHPEVYASTTGMAKIAQDEMNSVGFYTILLSIAALVLIYLLLARTFNGWVIPLFALIPLMAGIFWTMGTLQLIYGSLNLFTAMMGLVLLGLGIDFSVHVVTRYQEERGRGRNVEDAISQMFSGTGVAVIIGAVTTSLAFFTLLVGDTQGVSEFGTASGIGVLLTLTAIFLTLPALLVLLERRRERKGNTASAPATSENDEEPGLGYAWIGSLAAAGWRHPWLFLSVTALLVAGSAWAIRHTAYEYDFLELEAEGLRSVELQRQIPPRFGTSDHAAWLVTKSVEESRELKEQFRRVPEVGDVSAISDYLPSEERLADYTPKLNAFRAGPLASTRVAWRPGDAEALAVEVERLWDNVDLMSNLAFTAGLDRIVNVIDEITGVDSETGETDPTALLPTLFSQMSEGVDDGTMLPIAEAWATRLKANLDRMSNPAPIAMNDLPGNVSRSFLPRDGSEGLLLHVVPRRNLWNRVDMDRFATQTEAVDDEVIGTEKLMIVMMDSTLADGKSAALLALGVIALLLLLYFRGPRGLLALVPLAVGTLLMLGLMYVFRMKYNYMNLIATPIILGIGIDDGVHALHRFSEQKGKGVERVSNSFRFVGKAILLTSLTTMIGFGSVGFYEMRGMASFGLVLLMGVGTCFLATVFVLPATIRVFLREPAEENK
jgi:predicted RND superfamily exporter protein